MKVLVEDYTLLLFGMFPWQWFVNQLTLHSSVSGNASLIKR